MTKKEALRIFREDWIVLCINEPRWRNDKPAKCEAWNAYTDSLCKERRITLKQYESWANPF